MNGLMKKAGLGVALAATALSAAAPAEAQRYRRYHHGRGGDVATGALLGGIVGLGIGAAIASDRRDRYYYNDGYYYDRRPRVVYRDHYYAPPPRVVYRDRYYRYGRPYGYGYYGY